MADFSDYFRVLLLKAPVILLALTAHECAHAWVARRKGDDTAYMLGRLEIQAARDEAQQTQGAAFDVRAFHDRVLEDGAVPLAFLREKIRASSTALSSTARAR